VRTKHLVFRLNVTHSIFDMLYVFIIIATDKSKALVSILYMKTLILLLVDFTLS
jgi:hypothetical protein